jgi:hypothetical protein
MRFRLEGSQQRFRHTEQKLPADIRSLTDDKAEDKREGIHGKG